MILEPADASAAHRHLISSGKAWREANRSPWQPELGRRVMESSVGLAATPGSSFFASRFRRLAHHDAARDAVLIVETVGSTLTSTRVPMFEFEPTSRATKVGGRRRVRGSELGERLLAALPKADWLAPNSFEGLRLHPYVVVARAAAKGCSIEPMHDHSLHLTAEEVGRLNAAVEFIRTHARSLDPAQRDLLVRMREGARKNRRELAGFINRISGGASDYVADCFIAGRLDDQPRNAPSFVDPVALANALIVLNTQREQLVQTLQRAYKQYNYLRPSGLVWRVEHCIEFGPSVLLIAVLPIDHPMRPVLWSALRAAWRVGAGDPHYVEALETGLWSKRKSASTYEDFRDSILARVADVDRYARLDFAEIQRCSGIDLAGLNGYGKAALIPK